ncbi:hypothetical protein PENNAL_c0005G00730 [Penicillium nalgiovense]|uniref:Uncharacterized protein n=1 Tax=Penicillium nalgiovense TaxID=60175 RepID=A0A1V6Z1T0_PENNA|nr:hypothetical protein PENNAL_c0005G00730 [Penicillium nalgiovense]
MEGSSKLPEMADGHGEAPSSTQASSTENTPAARDEVSQPNHDTKRNTLAVEPFLPVSKILK